MAGINGRTAEWQVVTQVELDDITTDVSEFLRGVRDSEGPIDLVDHGEIVAHLLPVRRVSEAERARRWAALDELAAEIGKRAYGEVSAVEMVGDVRREL